MSSDSHRLCSISGLLSGGNMTTMGLSYVMIADEANTDSSRTIRLGVASGLVTIGVVAGNVVSGYVLERWDSYVLLFLIGQTTTTLAAIYCAFVLHESVAIERAQSSMSIGQIFRSFSVISRQRCDGRRRLLIYYMIAFLIYFTSDLGT